MDRHHLLPFVVGEFLQRVDDLNAGVADQDVDAAVRRDGCRDTRIDVLLVRHIHRDTARFATRRFDFGGRAVCGVEVQIGNDDLRTFARVPLRDGFADAARGTGDDRNFSIELHGGAFRINRGNRRRRCQAQASDR